MKQHEAVIEVMEENGGFATLGYLYQNVLKLRGCEWKTKTPFASMRRIVQDDRFFFKIRPGLWALNSWRERLPAEMKPGKKRTAEQDVFTHSYYQGLVVQIGNLKRLETFVPAQDKNRVFLGDQRLGDLASLSVIHAFSYPDIVRRAGTIDVVWFNERRMPCSVFEVEHSTNIRDSLVKFVELQDFRSELFIVADQVRRRQFRDTLELSAFRAIRQYVGFMSYDYVCDLHASVSKLAALEGKLHAMG
ncbi:MAG: hypothetical protein JXN61_03740 [Sedimentisphaerales bacterium]|nr:hypothetical protein [Sedimentisphaerales bacterium]